MTDDLRTQKLKWFVETGYVDGGGIGYWDGTKESIEVESQSAAYALRDEWLDKGKLIKTHWGELRPTFSYGTFRIRSIWVDVPNPLTDRIEELTEQLEAARDDAKEAEAYAEELEKEIELNEQEACMLEDDFIKAEKEIEALEAKLAAAVDWFETIRDRAKGDYMAHTYFLDAIAALTTLKGDKP